MPLIPLPQYDKLRAIRLVALATVAGELLRTPLKVLYR
jgi:hypothetical protein